MYIFFSSTSLSSHLSHWIFFGAHRKWDRGEFIFSMPHILKLWCQTLLGTILKDYSFIFSLLFYNSLFFYSKYYLVVCVWEGGVGIRYFFNSFWYISKPPACCLVFPASPPILFLCHLVLSLCLPEVHCLRTFMGAEISEFLSACLMNSFNNVQKNWWSLYLLSWSTEHLCTHSRNPCQRLSGVGSL